MNKQYRSKSRKIFEVCNILFLIILSMSMIIPILNTFAISFSTNMNSMSTGIVLWPKPFSLEGYETLFREVKILRPLLNNIYVTVVGTFLHVTFCCLTAYILARHEFWGKKAFMLFILITMMIPIQNIMIPIYIQYKKLHLLNKLLAIILTGTITAYSVILLKNFFEGIPKSIGESAYIDGATELQMLIKIYLPLAKPGIATVTLFQFVDRWNHFMEAVLFLNTPDKFTLQLALKSLVITSDGAAAVTGITKNTQMAGVVIAIIPLLIIYPFVQKYFVSGIMLGSTKG
ncbi:carbohydrate ABC transporter permease [Wukongibacter baidiensis]|uniref:carbohydrate ABC transporter permease n=1 Tax=Wukongibacter baidiensis TaxID=1723361 RepID=UPI003D7F7A60